MGNNFRENIFILLWIEDGILFGVYKKDMKIDLEAAKEIVRLRLELGAGRSYPALIDGRQIHFINKEARAYLAGPEGCSYVTKGAILVDSFFSKNLGNIFLRINKPLANLRLFTNKSEAIKWLKE